MKIVNSNQSLNTHNLISPHGKTFICEPSTNRIYPEYLREGRTQSVLHYYHGLNQLGVKNNYVNPNMNNSHSPSTRPDKIIPTKLAQNSSGKFVKIPSSGGIKNPPIQSVGTSTQPSYVNKFFGGSNQNDHAQQLQQQKNLRDQNEKIIN